MFEGELNTDDVVVGYVFVHNQLWRAKYLFNIRHVDPERFVMDYDQHATTLRDKYGVPEDSRCRNWSEIYANNLGRAIETGQGEIFDS